MRLRVPPAVRVALAGALVLLGLQIPMSTATQAASAAPFSCVPKFYQVSATNGGAFFEYNAASNSLSRVGTGAVSSINSIGYNTADNYIYGLSGTKVFRIDAQGAYDAGRTVSGLSGSFGGGDFYGGKLVAAPTSSNSWYAVDTANATATTYPMTGAANGLAGSATWGAYDLTVQGDVAYGLNGSTLYIAKMDTKQVSSRTVAGTTAGNYGAAYSDTSGNAFFYNNTDNKVYMFTAGELAKATGSATTPTAVLVGGAASTPALTAPNDGASCPNAVSPYVPGVDDESTQAEVDGTSATLGGSVNPNNTETTVHFCFGTDPTLADCEIVAATPGSFTGNTPQSFIGEVTELLPGRTYYYQVVATNSVGVNLGEIKSFTTPAGEPEPIEPTDQTIAFPPLTDLTVGEDQALDASASSGLPVSYTSLSPSVCTVAGGTVAATLPGTCEVAADQAGDEEYAAAPQVTRTFAVAPIAQTIDFAPMAGVTFGHPIADAVAVATSGLPVTVASTTPAVCSVGTDGSNVVALVAGTCELVATQPGDATRAAATPVTVSFVVAKAAQSVHLAPVRDLKVDRGPAQVEVTTSRDVVAQVASLTPLVCTAGAASAVNLVAPGTCTIEASVAADESYTSATDTVDFQVLPALVVTAPAPVAVRTGGTLDVSVPATGGVGPYTWAVTPQVGNSLPSGLTLDPATGRITGSLAKPGEYTVLITVTDADGEEVVREVRFTVASKLAGAGPSGRRKVVAGATLRLPDRSDEVVTWTYRLPAELERVRSADGVLVVRAKESGVGVHNVPLTVTDGVVTQTGVFRVTVLPRRVPGGTYRLGDGLASELSWPAVSGVAGYRVYVDGKLVGRTTAPALTLARPLGPKSVVTVRAVSGDGLLSAPRRIRYRAGASAERTTVSAVVYFGTSSAALDKGDRARLRDLVRAVRAAGFGHVRVTGHTDSRGTVARNRGLAQRRATAVRTYLGDRLKGLALTTRARGEQDPAASNATPDGMALNRRVEIRVW